MASQQQPSPRAHHVVVVHTYNTLKLDPDDVYEIRTPYAGPYYYNVMNLGLGTVYIREDADPDPDDAEVETLPAGHADNLILVPDGSAGLRFLAEAPHGARITLRLVRG